jgi:hypothetical protein
VFWEHHVKDNSYASYKVDLEPIGDFNDVETFMDYYKSIPPPKYVSHCIIRLYGLVNVHSLFISPPFA